jgi:hypothetical protein
MSAADYALGVCAGALVSSVNIILLSGLLWVVFQGCHAA